MALELNKANSQGGKFKRYGCNPTIDRQLEVLMSEDFDFMTSKEKINGECYCEDKQTCITIAEMLKKHNIKGAEDLIETLNFKNTKHD